MKKIEVITRPEKLVGLKEIFATHNCQGMTCLSVWDVDVRKDICRR